jgi:hypothetical protein
MNQINRHDSIAVGPVTRATAKVAIVLMLALAMMLASVAAPVRAGETGSTDVEAVRATVTETYNYKIGLLTDLKAGTDNPAKVDAYAGGIAELTALLTGSVATEPTIDGLWALKEQAYAIYEETVNIAKNAGMTDAEVLAATKTTVTDKIDYKIQLLTDWIEGCELVQPRIIVERGIAQLNALRPELDAVTTPDAAWAIKDVVYDIYESTMSQAEKAKVAEEKGAGEKTDDGSKDEEVEKTPAQIAAEKLAQARSTTLTLIARKTAILSTAADAAKIPTVVELFENAAQAVADLEAEARAAKTVKSLEEIRERVMEIYEGVMDDSSAIKVDEPQEGDMDDAGRAIEEHLAGVKAYVMNLVDRAEAGAQESPETFAALVTAKKDVLRAADAVAKVIESGSRLDDRWEDLRDALRDFRRAVIRHYVATSDGPMFIGGFYVAG